MIASHILSIVTFAPLIGAALIMLAGGSDVARTARWIALVTTLIEFAMRSRYFITANYLCKPQHRNSRKSMLNLLS